MCDLALQEKNKPRVSPKFKFILIQLIIKHKCIKNKPRGNKNEKFKIIF